MAKNTGLVAGLWALGFRRYCRINLCIPRYPLGASQLSADARTYFSKINLPRVTLTKLFWVHSYFSSYIQNHPYVTMTQHYLKWIPVGLSGSNQRLPQFPKRPWTQHKLFLPLAQVLLGVIHVSVGLTNGRSYEATSVIHRLHLFSSSDVEPNVFPT